uniref:uncharacterized protein LOC106999928 n=1 Tax=Macaca mulatta TaxID=9544 RepID=UPI0010A2800E|nr:uncharacterized protein LOC106999928 [Macaca mulatta]XP_028708723.1 uncharacterized protein LOC106999928 [Macaca mulatta]XP_045254571.1 uncharacterized protein LOC107130682 [Macaca fascicularis]XP_045254572.1 uncharacterized protein LOC107130682 [Macaca fascicularis]XP_045254573.1 uncharacterized protein LOC107130682 [Macaca fascicularis]
MPAGFQLSAHLRLRSLLQSGWEKGKFAKPRIPSPGEATKKLQHQQRLTSCGADEKRQLPFRGANVGSGWQRLRPAGGGQQVRGSRGPPGPPAPRGLPLHLSGGEDSAALRPCPRQVARLPPALRARCLQPPGATRAEAASAHGVMLPATTLRRIVTGRGERGERGREGSRHTQPPACQNARRRGHVPVESPRDLPRLHKAPQFGQEGRETATK